MMMGLLLTTLLAAEMEPAPQTFGPAWKQTGELPSKQAHQAAAADERFVYAITNDKVAKYDRATKALIAVSTGVAHHLNSGFIHEGRLYCAHSNFPQKPEKSEIMVLDPATMRLEPFHDFGAYGGSLTWAVRRDGKWWCTFVFYGSQNVKSYLAAFDGDWRETGRWQYPVEVTSNVHGASVSGGVWHGDVLLVTGHDDRVVFELRLPSEGATLQYVRTLPVPFTGQGIADDPVTGGLVGINRAEKLVLFAAVSGN